MPKLFVEDQDRAYLVDLEPGESLVVGRSPRADLPVASVRASRKHLRIAATEGGRHEAQDLGSTNGTTLNGEKLASRRLLEDGDVLDAAGCLLTYRSA